MFIPANLLAKNRKTKSNTKKQTCNFLHQ